MPPSFQVIDDNVVPHGGSYDTITPREHTVRNAMLVMTVAAPILGSFIIYLFSRKGWSYRSSWSYPRLAILWFWSVAIFGTLVFYQRGMTNRTTFMFAILHTQVEVLMNGLLLNFTVRNSLVLAGLWGLVLFTATLALPNISLVFIASSVLGGTNDFVVVLLLAYGKKWLYAAGALFHVISAVWVFVDSAIFLNVVLYNTSIFISLWLYIVLTTAAILRDSQIANTGFVRLPLVDHRSEAEGHSISDGQLTNVQNPMHDVKVPTWALYAIIVISLLGSSFITVLIYVFA
ncbi:hypothetical protein DFH08DRAFT_1090036 [Mycena albidolilacea]|uniref:Uncharacterized protein n=1 Tax=Mycena albidolilacea TaxID=1033008 RepID=A0AAD6YZG2_9AGAR|nr:hypothetical protein DFH08DRAFT_1090036 [Mycena albidolilacea]